MKNLDDLTQSLFASIERLDSIKKEFGMRLLAIFSVVLLTACATTDTERVRHIKYTCEKSGELDMYFSDEESEIEVRQ